MINNNYIEIYMVDLQDFIIKTSKNGSRRKLYRCACNTCNKDKGYMSKGNSEDLCHDCANRIIADRRIGSETLLSTKTNQVNAKGGDSSFYIKYKTKQVHGRTRYLSPCPQCNMEQWKRKNDVGKLCRRCSAIKTGISRRGITYPKSIGVNSGKKPSNYMYRKWAKGMLDSDDKILKDKMIGRISHSLRQRIKNIFKSQKHKDIKAGSACKDLGCSRLELLHYLESKFQSGMSWDNYGYKGWHIDHVIPLSNFDLTDREEFLKACHFTNLQPLWWLDNMKKSNKISDKYNNLPKE